MVAKDTNTERLREALRKIFKDETEKGKTSVSVVAGNLHDATEFVAGSHPNQMPSTCNIMNEFKESSDVVLHVTPSGRSSTFKICYELPRKHWK